MRVLISDNLGEAGVQTFKDEEGIEVDVKTGLSPEELKSVIADYDAIAIRSSTKITEDLLQAATRLKVIGRAGIGLDNVDIPAATKHGVAVMNTPGGNVITTAEHAIAMMMALTRNIPQGTASLKAGLWNKKKLQGRELCSKVLGVIGFGNIGSIVADRARGLKMRVMVHDPNITPERIEKAGFECADIKEVFRQADYITIHVPKMKSTIGLINKEAIQMMKDGVMIINCARGGMVDEADLYEAIKSGKVAGAALDVFETEPPGESPLFELDKVIATPHLGASTLEAQTNVAVSVAQQIVAFLKEGTVINAVNLYSVTGELLEKLSPYLLLGERMGTFQAQLVQSPIKEVKVEYTGDFSGLDIYPVTTAIISGLLSFLVKEGVNSINAPIIAKEMGIKVTEVSSHDSVDYTNLISVTISTRETSNMVAGTLLGKNDPRVVRLNKFRFEMIPEGHLALIHNEDRPGAIGNIGSVLGKNNINIGRMQVGQEGDGARNIILLKTDTPIPPGVVDELKSLDVVKTVIPLEL